MALKHVPRRSICLRRATFGGGFREAGEVDPAELFSESRDLILFIHGYAVNRRGAEEAYATFLANLDPIWRDMVAAVYWPGDSWQTGEGRTGISKWDIRPMASYIFMPERARQGAGKLKRALFKGLSDRTGRGVKEPLRLHIVAHSMGCRLALELLNMVEGDESRLKVALTALMAPAVARYKVQGYKGHEGLLAPALFAADRIRVYHSKKDRILYWTFKTGQALELDFPTGQGDREALGVRGGQDDRIVNRNFGLGHSQYWSSRRIARDLDAALAGIHYRMIFASIAPRPMPPGRPTPARLVA